MLSTIIITWSDKTTTEYIVTTSTIVETDSKLKFSGVPVPGGTHIDTTIILSGVRSFTVAPRDN